MVSRNSPSIIEYFYTIYRSGRRYELSEEEAEAFRGYEALIKEIEKTAITKSYKMALLKCMLDCGEQQWHQPITAETLVDQFMTYLNTPYRKRIDSISEDRKKVVKLIETMPMTKWSGRSKGLLTFEDGIFGFNFHFDHRCGSYFAKKAEKLN